MIIYVTTMMHVDDDNKTMCGRCKFKSTNPYNTDTHCSLFWVPLEQDECGKYRRCHACLEESGGKEGRLIDPALAVSTSSRYLDLAIRQITSFMEDINDQSGGDANDVKLSENRDCNDAMSLLHQISEVLKGQRGTIDIGLYQDASNEQYEN